MKALLVNSGKLEPNSCFLMYYHVACVFFHALLFIYYVCETTSCILDSAVPTLGNVLFFQRAHELLRSFKDLDFQLRSPLFFSGWTNESPISTSVRKQLLVTTVRSQCALKTTEPFQRKQRHCLPWFQQDIFAHLWTMSPYMLFSFYVILRTIFLNSWISDSANRSGASRSRMPHLLLHDLRWLIVRCTSSIYLLISCTSIFRFLKYLRLCTLRNDAFQNDLKIAFAHINCCWFICTRLYKPCAWQFRCRRKICVQLHFRSQAL